MSDSAKITRREMLQAAGLGAAAMALPGCASITQSWGARKGRLISPDRKLNIACIGCGGKGVSDVTGVSTENIVALCDVDDREAANIYKKYPDVPKYKDYRIMLEEMDDQIDAVTVTIPDHMHYHAALSAIKRGKHVWVQKPLTHSIWEARHLAQEARRHNVVTQMGNQGHAGEGTRLVREWAQAKVVGEIREVRVWTPKTVDGKYKSTLRDRPEDRPSIPESLDWDQWIGSAQPRPYHSAYHPRQWRNWWEFGNGALGDIGCHTMDASFYALDLGAPDWVEAETSGFTDETYPDWSIITYQFPARDGRPPVKMVWYDGGKLPPRPPELENTREMAVNGQLLIGDEGSIYDPTEKCLSPRVIPEKKMRDVLRNPPEKSIPRVPKGDPFQEWIQACKGGPKAGSNFDYSGPLTEMVLLGNIAIRAQKRVEWDAKNMRCVNLPDSDSYVRYPHRDGWA